MQERAWDEWGCLMSCNKRIPFIKIWFIINLVVNIQFETWSQKRYFKIVTNEVIWTDRWQQFWIIMKKCEFAYTKKQCKGETCSWSITRLQAVWWGNSSPTSGRDRTLLACCHSWHAWCSTTSTDRNTSHSSNWRSPPWQPSQLIYNNYNMPFIWVYCNRGATAE